jgi:hypothetical protein
MNVHPIFITILSICFQWSLFGFFGSFFVVAILQFYISNFHKVNLDLTEGKGFSRGDPQAIKYLLDNYVWKEVQRKWILIFYYSFLFFYYSSRVFLVSLGILIFNGLLK